METNNANQNESKKLIPLYLLIGALTLALIFQFFYFSKKVDSAKKSAALESAPAAQTFRHSSPWSSHSKKSLTSKNAHSTPSPMDDFFDDDPFAALDRIHSRLNNMMNTARTYAPIVMQQMNRDLSSDFIPAVDLEETASTYIVRADIPGLEKDKINITAENGTLVIQGTRETQTQHEDDQSGMYSTERSYGSFARTVALPGPVNESAIKADYKNGVLTIEIPKEKGVPSSTKRIPVQ